MDSRHFKIVGQKAESISVKLNIVSAEGILSGIYKCSYSKKDGQMLG